MVWGNQEQVREQLQDLLEWCQELREWAEREIQHSKEVVARSQSLRGELFPNNRREPNQRPASGEEPSS